MHNHVTINGLWCCSKLVQELFRTFLGILHMGCALELCFAEVVLFLIYYRLTVCFWIAE